MSNSKIELPVSELKRALTGLNKVMGKSTLPALRCVRLDRLATGEVTLCVTDLDSKATYGLDGGVRDQPLTFLIPWELFRKAATGNSERAEFIREKPENIVARTFVGGIAFDEPATMPPLDEWPFIPEPKGEFEDVSSSFKTALAEALSYASTDSSRFILNGACLDVNGSDGHYIVGTDASQIYSANTFKFNLPRSIVVPSRKFLTWSGFLDNGDWKMRTLLDTGTGGDWLELTSDRWVFQTKLIAGEYPNWRQVFPVDEAGLTTVRLQTGAIDMLQEVGPAIRTGEGKNEAICLSTRGGKLFVNNRPAADSPWNPIEVHGAVAVGPQKALLVSRERFLKALRMGFNELELRDSLTPMVLRGTGKQMALALYRGDTPQPVDQENEPSSSEQSTTSTTAKERKPMNTVNDRNKAPSVPLTTAPVNGERADAENPIRSAIAQVEKIREDLRECISALSQTLGQLKAAERDQKLTIKEFDSVRSTLRSLQRVQI